MAHLPCPLLSVIIPTLNEAENLPGLLADLKQQQDIPFEVIVGDGGSTDTTRSVAEAYGAAFVSARRGRGAQMNAAALHATGEYILFLHADSRIDDLNLLSNALHALIIEQHKSKNLNSSKKALNRLSSPNSSIGDPDLRFLDAGFPITTSGMTKIKSSAFSERIKSKNIAGHFRLKFMRTSSRNAAAYRYAEEKTAFNRVNTTNGDQGLLLSREFFRQLGSFDENMPFLEDQRIAEKIRSQGKWITLPGQLKTSARRFEAEGFHRRYILMSMMMGLHSVGLEDFFARAPGVYRLQQETGKLLLSPFFDLIWRMMREDWGLRGSIRAFYLLGRYIRENSWQMFYFIDIRFRSLLGAGRYPFLNFHDRVFAPCTDFKLFNMLTGLLCFIWFMGVLGPFFRVVDHKWLKMSTSL